MKVLFLDIDGVVNHHRTADFKATGWPIERYCAFLVGKIQLDTGCAVVLSSSWRHSPEGIKVVQTKVVKIIGTTTKNANSGGVMRYGTISRGTEIKMWLDEHPEVTRYAIVDDNGDMLKEQKPNFFQTSFHHGGLTKEIADQIIAHLNA